MILLWMNVKVGYLTDGTCILGIVENPYLIVAQKIFLTLLHQLSVYFATGLLYISQYIEQNAMSINAIKKKGGWTI